MACSQVAGRGYLDMLNGSGLAGVRLTSFRPRLRTNAEAREPLASSRLRPGLDSRGITKSDRLGGLGGKPSSRGTPNRYACSPLVSWLEPSAECSGLFASAAEHIKSCSHPQRRLPGLWPETRVRRCQAFKSADPWQPHSAADREAPVRRRPGSPASSTRGLPAPLQRPGR